MSGVPRKRRKVRALASVAKGHRDGRREPLGVTVISIGFSQTGDPDIGEFSDAVVLFREGDGPNEISAR